MNSDTSVVQAVVSSCSEYVTAALDTISLLVQVFFLNKESRLKGVKFLCAIKHHTMDVCVSGGVSPFVTSALDGIGLPDVSTALLARNYSLYPSGRLCGPLSQCGCCEERIVLLPRIETEVYKLLE